jgi:hypothetical protein
MLSELEANRLISANDREKFFTLIKELENNECAGEFLFPVEYKGKFFKIKPQNRNGVR